MFIFKCFNYASYGPGGGNITFDFMVSKLAGDKGMSLLRSLIFSVVTGLEFTIASTSTSTVCNDSLSKLFPCVLTKAFRIPLAVLVCLSQSPPMWLAIRGLLVQVIQSALCISKYTFILLWFMSWKDFHNSLTAPMSYFHFQTFVMSAKTNLYLENEQLLYE